MSVKASEGMSQGSCALAVLCRAKVAVFMLQHRIFASGKCMQPCHRYRCLCPEGLASPHYTVLSEKLNPNRRAASPSLSSFGMRRGRP